ncbi:helix-turn-helix domain-containing protein [Streptomyces tanashiensis]|uniref:helix-turn-helix domain-containing protein n=1 Tax=Streptomyces tanashiensis TaxID=67367 RepID=UPI0036BF5EC3
MPSTPPTLRPARSEGLQVLLSESDRDRLKRILKERRAAIDPVAVGFPARRSGPGRRAAGLSQEQMDELLKRTQGTYNRFENGRLASPSTEFLTATGTVLQLSQHEWAFLWRLTRKELPPAPLHPVADTATAGVWHHTIQRISGAAAYLHDLEWNIVAHNDDFQRLRIFSVDAPE